MATALHVPMTKAGLTTWPATVTGSGGHGQGHRDCREGRWAPARVGAGYELGCLLCLSPWWAVWPGQPEALAKAQPIC